GTDLSGSLQGSGGTGGLLARTEGGVAIAGSSFANTFYHADGNGNITCLIYSNQTVAARYEYDPYGNALSLAGSLASANVYQFASREYDKHSGLIHYLYRYYDPNVQSWLNRDPVEETDGPNLFRAMSNDLLNHLDSFGLCCE